MAKIYQFPLESAGDRAMASTDPTGKPDSPDKRKYRWRAGKCVPLAVVAGLLGTARNYYTRHSPGNPYTARRRWNPERCVPLVMLGRLAMAVGLGLAVWSAGNLITVFFRGWGNGS